MDQLITFFIILLIGVYFSAILGRLHIPWVVALIFGGVLIGPHGLDLFEPNQTIDFISEIGLVFLMFMAGLETQLSSFKKYRKGIVEIALVNALFPMVIGFGIGYLFGFGIVPSLLLGIIFVSSSIAVIIPTLEASGLTESRIGKTIVASTILEDVMSLILLSLLLQLTQPVTELPLPVFYLLLLAALIWLRRNLPKMEKWLAGGKKKTVFQQEVRSIFMILIGVVIIFNVLGLHPIVAGFFAGLVLSETIKSRILIEKIRAIAYGIFIPTFFIVVGTQTDISVFSKAQGALWLVLVVVVGSMSAKFISGFIAGKAAGFGSSESMMVGAATIPQLSTTLAVAYTAVELELVHSDLITAMVVLSIISTVVGPLLVKFFSDKLKLPAHN